MKYTHLFETVAEFTSAYNGSDYCEPWVSYIEENERVNYNKPDPSNGHPYVDLGLPSGTLWATCNVGASSPEEYGDYFAWGEVEPKSTYADDNYAWGSYTNIPPDLGMTKYNTTDEKMVLEPEDDAAHVNMGGEWHMPTSAQCQELIDNTISAWTDNWNGTEVTGIVFTSTANTNSIFIPAGGEKFNNLTTDVGERLLLLTSSRHNNPGAMWFMYGASFDDGPYECFVEYDSTRSYGTPVRGVITPAS